MPDVREVFDMVTQKAGPEPGALQRQGKKQRNRARNQKIAVIGVVAVIVVAGASVFLNSKSGDGSTPATQPPNPPSGVPFNTTPPIGAQVVALDGTPLQQIAGLPADAYGLQISRDGGTIAFHAGGRIETLRVDGTGGVQVLDGVPQNTNSGDAMTAVSWSPQGTQLVYAYSGDILVINASGGTARRLTRTTASRGNYYPAWSPDGSTIAYWSGSKTGGDGGPSDAEIYTIPAPGGSPTRLTHDDVSDIEPAWSPDGTKIAYFHGGDLWVMNADGSGKHLLHAGSGGHWAPAWSPDGTTIAYLSYYGNNADGPLLEVKTIDLQTKDVTDLGIDVVTDFNGPSWMPSGDALLVNREN
jgi:Tol biopolymer transport system component